MAVDPKSKAFSGKGTSLSIDTSANGTPNFIAVAELKTFQFSGSKNDTEDVTNSDSAGRAREFIVTLLDAGEMSCSGNYIGGDAGQGAFRAAFASGALVNFKLQLPLAPGQTTSGDFFLFTGLVTENDLDIQHDKAITFSSKIKISGEIDAETGS